MKVMKEDSSDLNFTSSDCTGEVFITNDGYIYCVSSSFQGGGQNENGDAASCDAYGENPCGDSASIYVDVNGEKGPNKLTQNSSKPRDIYPIQVYAQSVVPYDEAAQQIMYDKSNKT